jgi:hypothetical protein
MFLDCILSVLIIYQTLMCIKIILTPLHLVVESISWRVMNCKYLIPDTKRCSNLLKNNFTLYRVVRCEKSKDFEKCGYYNLKKNNIKIKIKL